MGYDTVDHGLFNEIHQLTENIIERCAVKRITSSLFVGKGKSF